MNKQIVIIGIIVLLVSVGLFVYTQQDHNSNTNTNGIDSDNDGYADNIDDFPTDPNLHEKISIISSSDTFEQNQGLGAFFDINGDCKFVVINWEVTNPRDLTADKQHDIVFELTYPPNNTSIDYPYNLANNRNLRFTIDSSNRGKWVYGFGNMGVISNVTIYREIFLLK
jgi:hypothetical protein